MNRQSEQSCERWRRQLLAAGDRPAPSSALEAHLRACPECRGFAAAAKAMLDTPLPQAEPPAQLDAAIKAHARARLAAAGQSRRSWLPLPFPNYLRAVAAAAAILAVAALGWWRLAGTPEAAGDQRQAASAVPNDHGAELWPADPLTELIATFATALETALHQNYANPFDDGDNLHDFAAHLDLELHTLEAEIDFVAFAFD